MVRRGGAQAECANEGRGANAGGGRTNPATVDGRVHWGLCRFTNYRDQLPLQWHTAKVQHQVAVDGEQVLWANRNECRILLCKMEEPERVSWMAQLTNSAANTLSCKSVIESSKDRKRSSRLHSHWICQEHVISWWALECNCSIRWIPIPITWSARASYTHNPSRWAVCCDWSPTSRHRWATNLSIYPSITYI